LKAQQKFELGLLLANYMEAVMEMDADILMTAVIRMQDWIDQQIREGGGRERRPIQKDDNPTLFDQS
jgi:hypothetical protein